MNKEYPYEAQDVFNMCGEYLDDSDLQMIKKAYELAREAHEGQFRKNGLPYIAHPVQVAGILAELNSMHRLLSQDFCMMSLKILSIHMMI